EPDPLQWQPLATQFELAARAGVHARVVSRPEYNGSGLTAAAFRGADYLEASDVDSLGRRMLAGLADRPALVYGYLSNVDTAGHDAGLDSPQWREAVALFDQLLTILVDGLTPGSALIVTADHGQLDIPLDRRFDLDTEPGLRDGIRVVAG